MSHPHIWYPYTQAKTASVPYKVKKGSGIWLELADGRRIIDCISSWWVNNHGHTHPHIVAAISKQAAELEQVIFAGFTHDRAEELASKLVAVLPNKLQRVFYSDNGSTAVEVSLKMAYQYWVNKQQPRHKFIAFKGAYHGDTFGAMSVGNRSLFSQAFNDLLFQVDFVDYPGTYHNDPHITDREDQIIASITQMLAQEPPQYAGIIIEPLVQGAGGMAMGRSIFLQKLSQLAKEFDTLLIFDEVMTGFGRTGDWFACTKAQVQPDLICLSKGLTGGFLPLSVTVATEEIYQGFYSDNPLHTLYHGHSFTANPLGCAAALAGLDLMIENEPRFKSMEAQHWHYLERFKTHPLVEKIRVTGTIAAMDIIEDDGSGYLNQIGMVIRQKALDLGLLLRPLGNILYIMPPYCITDQELGIIYAGIEEILETVNS